MILGVDLTGEDLERYEAVHAARIKMELEGVPSPFVVNPYAEALSVSRRRPRGTRGRAPALAPRLRDWLANRARFKLSDAADALNAPITTVAKTYNWLRENDLTDAELSRKNARRKHGT